MAFILGIPTLIRHDLLKECLDSAFANTVPPEIVYIVDNYGGFSYPDQRVRVIAPPENLGVCRSWNLLHRLTYPHDLVISNDDIVFERAAFETLLATPGAFVALCGWACFLERQECWDRLGDYCERDFFAYYEDEDRAWRMQLAGIPFKEVPGLVRHHGSATLKGLPQVHADTVRRHCDNSRRRYLEMWGGEPHREVYTTPFNRPICHHCGK